MDGKVITEALLRDIGRRARGMGFRRDDVADAIQEVALSLFKFEYNPEQWKGMDEAAAVNAFIGRRLKDLRRKQQRYERAVNEMPKTEDAGNDGDLLRGLDVRNAVSTLSPEEQAVCLAIEKTASKAEAAERLGCSVDELNETLAEIRERFTVAGVMD